MFRRILFILAVPFAAVIAFSTAAWASVATGTYSATFDSSQAPASSHVANGSAQPTCTVNTDLSISCNSYTLGGVGNTNATAELTANYSATIDCFNKGTNPNNPVESHTSDFTTDTGPVPLTPSRNGQLRVPSLSAQPFSAPQVCPNPNWTPKIRAGTLVLNSFKYTLTFVGFGSPYITIAAP